MDCSGTFSSPLYVPSCKLECAQEQRYAVCIGSLLLTWAVQGCQCICQGTQETLLQSFPLCRRQDSFIDLSQRCKRSGQLGKPRRHHLRTSSLWLQASFRSSTLPGVSVAPTRTTTTSRRGWRGRRSTRACSRSRSASEHWTTNRGISRFEVRKDCQDRGRTRRRLSSCARMSREVLTRKQ